MRQRSFSFSLCVALCVALWPNLSHAANCVIRIGANSNTYTYTGNDMTSGKRVSWGTVRTSDFIRSTQGPCHFELFNGSNYSGHKVVIGSNLTGRIRAGEDGVRFKDSGGGATWRIRSIRMIGVRPSFCRISLGGNGIRMEYGEVGVDKTPAMDFADLTRGACHYKLHNSRSYAGKYVTLGANLSTRIRIGIDGIENKDGGGGDTWRVRSFRVEQIQTNCRLHIGGNGVRMDYFASTQLTHLPAMNRISWFTGGDCGAEIWPSVNFGAADTHKRSKLLHPSGQNRGVYDPGFRVRSLKIRHYNRTCPAFAKDQGRCLPQHTLLYSIYDNPALLNIRQSLQPLRQIIRGFRDADHDGLEDYAENQLAAAFRPIYYNHSTENATRTNVYRDLHGNQVMEPVTIYQVRPDPTGIVIVYMKLWLWDRYNTAFCGGHKGDSQAHSIYLRTYPRGNPLRGKFWYIWKTSGGINNGNGGAAELRWQKGFSSLRGSAFEGSHALSRYRDHEVIHFSKGKHHEYADRGYSGQTDKNCWNIRAYTNGQGHLHTPAYPRRLAIIRSPAGAGDYYNYNNVGSRAHPFFNDLRPFGFTDANVYTCCLPFFPGTCNNPPGICTAPTVWSGNKFYSSEANPVDRQFH